MCAAGVWVARDEADMQTSTGKVTRVALKVLKSQSGSGMEEHWKVATVQKYLRKICTETGDPLGRHYGEEPL